MRILRLFFGILLFPFYIHSQSSQPEFEHLSIDQGLYQSTVNCMLQDKRGLLWFGTNDGLNRYDGYSFKTYRNASSDNGSISENNITALGEDDEGNIWIGTLSGFINIYDPLRNIFVKYKLEFFPLFLPPKKFNEDIPPCYSGFSSGTITAIHCDKNEFIWIGTFGSGLFRFDPYENSLIQYYYSDELNTISSDYILSIAEDENGVLWIGTFTGGLNKLVMKIDPKTRKEKELKFSAFLPDKKLKNSISTSRVTSLKFFNEKLWIGTFGGGLNILFTGKGGNDSGFACIKPVPGQNSLSSNLITKIESDKFGNLWIGTFGGGLTRFNLNSNSFLTFKNDPLNKNTIDNNEVVSLLTDRFGIVWTGTFSGYGINKLNPVKQKFPVYKSDPAEKNSLSDNLITAFAEDSKGNIWIGTYKGGLNKFIPKEKSFASFRLSSGIKGFGEDYITCILADRNDKLWIGTYDGGLNIFDPSQNKFSRYLSDGKNKFSISSNRISSILQDKNGAVWIGTFNMGLNKVSAEKEGLKFTAYRNNPLYPGTIPSDNVFKLFLDRDGNLWMITGGRFLSVYNYDTEEFTNYELDSSGLHTEPEILSLSQDDHGNLWLGTAGRGLVKFDSKTKSFISSDNPFIIRDKYVYGILADKFNSLWISTNYGLVKYDPGNQSALNFNLNDGLQSLKYTGACMLTKRGEMFFGGINGFNCFFPGSIKNEIILPEIIITSLIISNKETFAAGSIDLNSSENSFSIYFSSTDYTDPLKNQYLYKLEGYDNEWRYASGNAHSAEYKDLPAGSYAFKVKGTGSSGIWTRKSEMLYINIPVVFWRTWWFISISVLISAVLIFYFIFYRIRQLLIIEKLKTKLSADLHDSVGSGLTEITLLCEIVRRDYKNELKTDNPNLSLIAQKSRELADNMSDIVWLVNPKPNTLYDLMLRLRDIYFPVLNSLGITFKVEIPDSIKDLKIDLEERQNIYLIFKEAINNSIKYSRAAGISLKLETAENSFKIILKDNGCGFDINSVRGNGLGNMKRRAENIHAGLSIHSAEGKGTSIVLEWKE